MSLWSIGTYAFERQTIAALLRPAGRQQFIYTSPIGGVDFLFRVSLYVAFILSIPVIIYHFLCYIEPLLSRSSRLFIVLGSFTSGVLAVAGLLFGYFVGLPAAMHFLLHQFMTAQIKPLLTVQSYLSFVMVYMLGSALMLQIPLILVFINRIRPLRPRTLLRQERWVILGAFIMAGLMNPTPNLWNQLLVAGPLILMYQVGIAVIALANRQHRAAAQRAPLPRLAARKAPPLPEQLLLAAEDEVQAVMSHLRPGCIEPSVPKAFDIVASPRRRRSNCQQQSLVVPAASPAKSEAATRPRQYIDGFIMSRRPLSPPSRQPASA